MGLGDDTAPAEQAARIGKYVPDIQVANRDRGREKNVSGTLLNDSPSTGFAFQECARLNDRYASRHLFSSLAAMAKDSPPLFGGIVDRTFPLLTVLFELIEVGKEVPFILRAMRRKRSC